MRARLAGLLVQFVADQDAIGFPVLGTSCRDHVGGQFRSRWSFGPLDPFQIVADKLFIKRRLRAAGAVLGGGPEARRIWRERFIDPDKLLGCFASGT